MGFFFNVDWIHVLRMATISFSFSDGAGSLWKRVNTNSLMSVDNSLNEYVWRYGLESLDGEYKQDGS